MNWGVLLIVLSLSAVAMAQLSFDPPDPLDGNPQTGLELGEKIPAFRAVDQNGRSWSFDTLKGPKGALLLFFRSADW